MVQPRIEVHDLTYLIYLCQWRPSLACLETLARLRLHPRSQTKTIAAAPIFRDGHQSKQAIYHFFSLVLLYKYRGLEDDFMKVQQYKSEARRALTKEGYRIWGIIGDQWSSVEGLPGAKRTFKLPNSMYYLS